MTLPRDSKESKKEPAPGSPPKQRTAIPVDEEDLIRRLRQGQQWSCNVLVDLYQERLLKLAWGITWIRKKAGKLFRTFFSLPSKKLTRSGGIRAVGLVKKNDGQCLS